MNHFKCLPPEIATVLRLVSSTEKTEHAMIEPVHIKSTENAGGKR